jgi:hypothetical protein
MSESVTVARAEFTLRQEQVVGLQRRTAVRYRCALATSGWLSLPSGDTLETWIVNLSAAGIGLSLPHPLELGMALVVHLRGPALGAGLALPARVIHATPEDEGSWRVGCAFDRRLNAETLTALL